MMNRSVQALARPVCDVMDTEEKESSLTAAQEKQKIAADPWCEGPLMKKIIVYAIPIMLSSVLQLLFNAADLVVVGRFRGSTSVAGVGSTGALTSLVVNFFIGISTGCGIAVAQAIGAKKERDVHRYVHSGLLLAVFLGLFLTGVGVGFTPAMLRAMGSPEDVLPKSILYLRVYFCGMTGNMVYNFAASILRAAGDTKRPLYYLTIAGVLNALLNVFFVAVLGMDVDGVALATILTQLLSAVLTVRALMKRTDACHFEIRKLHWYTDAVLTITRIGLPSGIQSSLYSIANVVIQSSVNSLGTAAVTGNAAGANLEGFVWAAYYAFSTTASNFAGRNMGAGKYKRLLRVLKCCELGGMLTALICGSLVYVFNEALLGIYITDSAEAIQFGVIRLFYVSLMYFICAYNDVALGVMRGMGYTFVTMVITVICVCVFRLVWIAVLFPSHHTLDTILVSYPISWILASVVNTVAFVMVYRRLLQRRTA